MPSRTCVNVYAVQIDVLRILSFNEYKAFPTVCQRLQQFRLQKYPIELSLGIRISLSSPQSIAKIIFSYYYHSHMDYYSRHDSPAN